LKVVGRHIPATIYWLHLHQLVGIFNHRQLLNQALLCKWLWDSGFSDVMLSNSRLQDRRLLFANPKLKIEFFPLWGFTFVLTLPHGLGNLILISVSFRHLLAIT